MIGFTRPEAASIGIIGAIDGPTSIYVSASFAPHLLGPTRIRRVQLHVAGAHHPATDHEVHDGARGWHPYAPQPAHDQPAHAYPVPPIVDARGGILVLLATPLIGMLMLGNPMKESGAVGRLTRRHRRSSPTSWTLFLGLAIGATMVGTEFLRPSTLAILVLSASRRVRRRRRSRVLTLRQAAQRAVVGGRVNPLVGAAGINAMAARVAADGTEEGLRELLLMHAMGERSGPDRERWWEACCSR